MTEDPKKIVEQAYDYIAEWYLQWVQGEKSPRERYTNKVLENGPSNPRVLELGCGPGVPITRMLLDRGAIVVANDISTTQISMAKARCPEATLISGNMADLSFEPRSFDGVTCFYTIFHLPRAEQKDMLSKIYSWLKPGGMLVCNFATIDEEEIHGEMMGHGMFWSSYDVDDNKTMLEEVGFQVAEVEVLEAGDGQLEESDPDHGAEFMWVAAKKASDQ